MKVCDLRSNYVLRVLPVSDVIWMCVCVLGRIEGPVMEKDKVEWEGLYLSSLSETQHLLLLGSFLNLGN